MMWFFRRYDYLNILLRLLKVYSSYMVDIRDEIISSKICKLNRSLSVFRNLVLAKASTKVSGAQFEGVDFQVFSGILLEHFFPLKLIEGFTSL